MVSELSLERTLEGVRQQWKRFGKVTGLRRGVEMPPPAAALPCGWWSVPKLLSRCTLMENPRHGAKLGSSGSVYALYLPEHGGVLLGLHHGQQVMLCS